jgi:CubicO group peptidase (beta-lactamase class C family)
LVTVDGFDPGAAGRLRDVLEGYVEQGDVPGVVAAVAQGDELLVEAVGRRSFDEGDGPMRGDSIFRITSMTKPMVAVAALTLAEEGRLDLDEPVDRLLPELANMQVLEAMDGPLDQTVPAERAITVDDVLTFRLGWGTPAADFFGWPLFARATELGLHLGPPLPRPTISSDEWIAGMGSLPLLRQPGEAWLYDVGASVLGVLVERAAGAPLPDVLRERVLQPLGMRDTGWHVPAEDLHRLTTSYGPLDGGGFEVLDPGDAASAWAQPPSFPDGASGLVSTVGDCVAFGSMLIEGGTGPSGEAVLGRQWVQRMTTDQLTAEQREDSAAAPFLDGGGWGLGVGIDPQGRHLWAGGFGTVWRNDPSAGRVEVLLTQRAVYPVGIELIPEFWAAAEQLAPATEA